MLSHVGAIITRSRKKTIGYVIKTAAAAALALALALAFVISGCNKGIEPAGAVESTASSALPERTAAAAEAVSDGPAAPEIIVNIEDADVYEDLEALIKYEDDGLPPVAQVAGVFITQREYRYMLRSFKNALLLNSGIEAGSDEDVLFWTRTASNGKTRLDEARDKVLSELHQLKICGAMAGERGIAPDKDELENLSTDLRAQEDRFGGRERFEKVLSDEYGLTLSDYLAISEEILLRDMLLADEAEKIEILDGDVLAYYEQNQNIYGDMVRLNLILFLTEGADVKSERSPEATRQLADGVLAALGDGADMDALARESSEEPNAAINGGERVVSKEDPFLPVEVLEWAFGANEGDAAIIEASF